MEAVAVSGDVTPLDEQNLRVLAHSAKDLARAATGNDGGELSIIKFSLSFRSILLTCQTPDLHTSQQIAAWNALCAFIDQLHLFNGPQITRTFEAWQQSFDLFLARSQEVRPKSTKQLLVSLSTSLRRCQDHSIASIVANATISQMLKILFSEEEQIGVRPALILLSHFLSRDIITLQQLCDVRLATTGLDAPRLLAFAQDMLTACLNWSVKSDFASAASTLISTVLKSSYNENIRQTNTTLWLLPVLSTLVAHPESLDSFRIYLLPPIFKQEPQGFLNFVRNLADRSDPDFLIHLDAPFRRQVLLAVLQVGKENGMAVEVSSHALDFTEIPIKVPFTYLEHCLQSAHSSLRLASLDMLINSSSTTRPIADIALEILKKNMFHLHANTDANFRSEFFSHIQRLFDRLRAISTTQSKSRAMSVADNSSCKDFLHWYSSFLCFELRPGASYQRHISALKCLSLMVRSGVDKTIAKHHLSKSALTGPEWTFTISLFPLGTTWLLLDLLIDPYDDVRQGAATLLEIYQQSTSDMSFYGPLLESSLSSAETMMLASGRADHADGVAHLNTLCFTGALIDIHKQQIALELIAKAEHMASVAEQHIGEAVSQYPLHGLLTSIRYIIASNSALFNDQNVFEDRLIALLQNIWHIVKSTLCNDAPEGHLPADLEEVSDNITTKDILSYCWRALKEASLLGQALLHSSKSEVLTAKITALTFTQLAELRHRGAFSTVAQTWTSCCEQTAKSAGSLAFKSFYERTLALIESTTINTRRSAGMPSLLCGILIADRTFVSMEQAFNDLTVIALRPIYKDTDESSLPQVHAMNCLKDILKHSRLAEQSGRHVPATLHLATSSLRSSAWAVRNCGLMLLRAAIDRLLGTNDSHDGLDEVKSPMDFRQHPKLLDQFLQLLESEQVPHDTSVANEGIFPALQLLHRAQLPEARKSDVCGALFALLGNESWMVRDKAARTLVSLMPNTELLRLVDSALTYGDLEHNRMHGYLLCVKHIKRLTNPAAQAASRSTNFPDGIECDTQCTDIARTVASRVKSHILRDFALSVAIAGSNGLKTSNSSGLGHANQVHNTAITALLSCRRQIEADAWLITEASRLGRALRDSDALDSTSIMGDLSNWLATVESVARPDSFFESEIVLRAVNEFGGSLSSLVRSPSRKHLAMRFCLLLCDLINDDDDQNRNDAAIAISRLLGDSVEDALEPLVAEESLLRFMADRWHAEAEFGTICIARALGHTRNSVAEQLSSAMLHDTTLFAEEKQNLYIDETRQVMQWSKTLAQVDPGALQRRDLDQLVEYVVSGFKALLTQGSEQQNAPIGPASIDEVFVIGIRVIYGARFLLLSSQASVLTAEQNGALTSGLKEMLAFTRAGVVHPLWQEELEGLIASLPQ